MFVEKCGREHRAAVMHLLKAHSMWSRDSMDQLPKLGFVVYMERGDVDKCEAVCAGFLREIEGGSYLFDSLISNPKLNSEQRHRGMSMLWSTILEAAKGCSVLGFTDNAGTMQRAEDAGFTRLPHVVLSLTRQK